MTKALILIDYENEWMDSHSEYFLGGLQEVLHKTNSLIRYARKNKFKIIFTKHIEKESDTAFQENSSNVAIISQLDLQEHDTVITKYTISPFLHTKLSQDLGGIEQVIIAGLVTNLCVRMTVEECYDRELDITLISDCCTSFDQETHDFTLKDLKLTRPEIKIITLQQLL